MEDRRAPDIKEQAKQDYLEGMKYKDLAEKYNVSLNTIKSWKTRYNWNRKSVHTKEKVCIQKKNIKNRSNELVQQEVEEVLSNSELTDKQRLFCIIYSRCLNATKAYQKAYKCSYETAMVEGCRSLRNPKINEQIEKLNAVEFNKEFIKRSVIQKHLDIAFSDINDFIGYGQREVTIGEDEDGNPIKEMRNYVDFKNSSEVDRTLIQEVTLGRNGIGVKLQDKMKALQWLSDRVDLLPTATQQRLKYEEEKLQMAREKLELEKGKDEHEDKPIEVIIKRKRED